MGENYSSGSIAGKIRRWKKTFLLFIIKTFIEFFPNYTKEWSKNNVLINTIRVGAASTNLHSLLPLKNFKKREKLISVGRVAEPREIAEFIYFLVLMKIVILRIKFQLFLVENKMENNKILSIKIKKVF